MLTFDKDNNMKVLIVDDEPIQLELPRFGETIRVSSLTGADEQTRNDRAKNISLAICDLCIKRKESDEELDPRNGEEAICMLRDRLPRHRPVVLNSIDPPTELSGIHEGVLINDPKDRVNPVTIEKLVDLWQRGSQFHEQLKMEGKLGTMPCPRHPPSEVIQHWWAEAGPIFLELLGHYVGQKDYIPNSEEVQRSLRRIRNAWFEYHRVAHARGIFFGQIDSLARIISTQIKNRIWDKACLSGGNQPTKIGMQQLEELYQMLSITIGKLTDALCYPRDNFG